MKVLNMPRQSGRTTTLLKTAIESAVYNGKSLVVVPTAKEAEWIRDELRRMDPKYGSSVIVESWGSFINGNHVDKIRAVGMMKHHIDIYIDDLDSCLNMLGRGYGEVDLAVIEKESKK